MSGPTIQNFVVVSAKQSAASKASFTTAASVINNTDVYTFPANWFQIGTRLRIRIFGAISNVVTAQPTFTFQVMLGAVAVWSSGAITTNATANTLLPFWLDVELRCDSIGSGTSAAFFARGLLVGAAFAAGSTAIATPVASTPAAGTGFDSTAQQALDFFIACQTSNAGNAVRIHDYCVEELY